MWLHKSFKKSESSRVMDIFSEFTAHHGSYFSIKAFVSGEQTSVVQPFTPIFVKAAVLLHPG